MKAPAPLRVLQVVGAMDRGGIETWLMHLLRRVDPAEFRIDFLVHTRRPGAYDEEVESLGARVLPCPNPGRPWGYARRLRRILRQGGPYDAVHSHVHHFSGCVLRLARAAGVPVRVAHSHTDTSALEARAGLVRRAYLGLMRRWLRQAATACLAASRPAATALFGAARSRVLHCGIDLEPFAGPADRAAVRAELGVPPGAFVLGHVGRLVEEKNHQFVVEISRAVLRRRPEAWLVLVGDGPRRAAIEREVSRAGVGGRVVFAGARSDVPRLMLGALDVLLLPSLREGLPLVGIEAQAAGVPLLASAAVTDELDVVPGLVHRLSLAEPAEAWADAALACRPADRGEALARVRQSPFNIEVGLRALEEIYAGRGG